MLGMLALAALWTHGSAIAAEPPGLCSPFGDGATRLAACTSVIEGNYPADERARAFRIRGEVRLSAGAADDAIADLDQSIKLDAAQAEPYAGRAQARLLKGDAAGAVADLDKAIAINSGSAFYYNARGHARLVLGEPRAALADFNEAIRLDPRAASARNNRGLAHMKLAEPDAAIEDYTVAVGINARYALAFNNRGYAYEAKGLKPEAIADFKRAIEIDPTLAGAREGLQRLGAKGLSGAATDVMVEEGRRLVQKNCAWCHATGASGPSPNRKAPEFRSLAARHPVLALREPLARSIAAPHSEMPNFRLPPSEIDKIIAYIDSLARASEPKGQP